MADLGRVPVVDVTKENFKELWPSLILAIKSSLYVAVDLELTGLGSKKGMNAKEIEERYKAMAETAKTRAVIAFGLSCFKLQEEEKPVATARGNSTDKNFAKKNLRFIVQTFNILVLCDDDYTIEASSAKFLVAHGFDFTRQIALGLPYCRGNDKEDNATKREPTLRQLFNQLVIHKKPMVLHNGIFDLIFLYHSFYCNLPRNLGTFLTDLTELFPSGVFDTKYISDYKARLATSFLEYVFRRRQRENASKAENGKVFVELQFLQYDNQSWVEYRDCALRPEKPPATICRNFANHGYCRNGQSCTLSHDIDDILDAESAKKRKKSKRRSSSDESMIAEDCSSVLGDSDANMDVLANQNLANGDTAAVRTTGIHRAGYDAFMTGYAFATFLLSYMSEPVEEGNPLAQANIKELKNKIYLTRKSAPLLVRRSNFEKSSVCHTQKINLLRPSK